LQTKQVKHDDTDSFDGGGLRQSIHPVPESTRSVPNGECFIVFYVKKGFEKKHERKRDVRFI